MIGAVIMVFVLASSQLGICLNPAQYLSGTVFCNMVGWPDIAWSRNDDFIWVALLAPLVGSLLGCLCLKLYYVVIFNHPIYWLGEITNMIHAAAKGLVPVRWGKLELKQYNASEAYQSRPRNSDIKEDMDAPLVDN